MRIAYHDSLAFISREFLDLSNWIISTNKTANNKYTSIVAEGVDDLIYSRKDIIYMEMAKLWAKNSHCKRMQVGCLIVKDKSIISDGYNGTPTGFSNCCEDENDVTLPLVLHAEANALTKLAKGTQSSEGSTLYVTLSPCFECSKLIIQSGIKRVVFLDLYRNSDPVFFLAEAGIELNKLTLTK